MLSLSYLSEIFTRYGSEIDAPVDSFKIGGRHFDFVANPAIMGVINLSHDSWYRESISLTTQSAIARGRKLVAEGADIIDLGAEATMAETAQVNAAAQIAALVPVIEGLRAEGIIVSAETYSPEVVEACLVAGANVLNLTGREHESEVLELAASFDATVIMCYVQGMNIREVRDFSSGIDFTDRMLDHFAPRIQAAKAAGVSGIFVDPLLSSPRGGQERLEHQVLTLLTSFRLRALGQPVCNALLAGYEHFEEQYRDIETFFATLAALGGTNLYRTHEVPKVRAVLRTMQALP